LIASDVYLDTLIDRFFCNLRKPPAGDSIDIFLATGGADVSRYITNDNGGLPSGKGNCCGSWFRFSILTDYTCHERFLLVFISDSHLLRVGSYVVITITRCFLLSSAATTWIGRSPHHPKSNLAGNGKASG
jgi:hypothetical protein